MKSYTRNSRKRRSVESILVAIGVAYPIAVYFGLRSLSPLTMVAVLPVLIVLRLVFRPRNGTARDIADVFLLAGGLALVVAVSSPLVGLKFYPIFISLGLAGFFGYTLLRPPTIIERIARIREADVTDAALPYFFKVTTAWVCFFLVNAGLSAWTALDGSLELWTLYNGLISYVLMGGLFAIEFVIRRFARHRYDHTP